MAEITLGPPTICRGYRFRLYPTPAQEAVLEQWCGAVRAVYNAAWEQRDRHWRAYLRAHGKRMSFASQSAEIKNLRAEFDWIAAVPFDALTYALRDLDRAYGSFFAGRAKYPTPRKRGVHESVRVRGRDAPAVPLNAKWSAVRFPKLGLIRYRAHRPLAGTARNVTVSHRSGAWWVSFSAEIERQPTVPAAASAGIDRGVAQTLTLSTGEVIQAPDTSRLLALRKRAQRTLARRKRGSKRYAAAKARVARLSARQAAARADWSHRASHSIASRFGLVAIEALNVAGMTASARGTADEPGRNVRQKAGLNRSILEQSWSRFATFLDYKLAANGGVLIAVAAAYTSQTCSVCGVIDARSRKSQAVFVCVACGHAENADINAAKEILRRSTSGLDVEAGVTRPTKRQPEEQRHA